MWVILILVLLVFVLVVIQDVVRKSGTRWRHLNKFPGDWPLPLIGNALQLGFNADVSVHRIMDMWKRHGKSNIRVTVGSEEWVLLCEPEDIAVLLSHQTELKKAPERNAAVIPFFGHSVSTSEGEKWRWTRKLMAPSFQYNTLESRVQSVNKGCERLLDKISKHENDSPINVYHYIRGHMFDLLCSTLLGVEYNYLDDANNKYMRAIERTTDIITENIFSHWRHIKVLFQFTSSYKEMNDVIDSIKSTSNEIIQKRRSKLQKIIDDTKNNNKDVKDLEKLIQTKLSENSCLLDNLILNKLPDGKHLSNEMINEEISLLCYTGQYTTSMSTAHTLYCLAKFPEVQRRVLDEQHSIFGSEDRQPTNRDLNEMKYLDAVIKETMRYIPTVPKISRHLQEDLKLKDGRILPAKTIAVGFLHGLFFNEKVFAEPEKFIPERFYNCCVDTYSYVPFSAGPRNCIGFRYAWVAMKATISNILRKFEVLEGGPEQEPRFEYRLITESTNGVKLKFKKRF